MAELRERGVRVVDLSADFRLHDRATSTRSGTASTARPALIGDAVYGLPELHRDEIAGADLVANPGCYPTAAILALAPLARAGLLGDVVIDAKSGVSGAGREPTARQALRRASTRPSRRTRSAATATRRRSSRSSAAADCA